MDNLTPKAIVAELDKYIVGQAEAKKAMAVALRNRYRRRQLPEAVRRDVMPKNILMIGPTGVGKTEIARRVALLSDAPFIKVEATKFTEVGYVGRDVESIVHDLVEGSVTTVHEQKLKEVQPKAESLAVERLVGYICEQSCGDVVRLETGSTRVGGKVQGISMVTRKPGSGGAAEAGRDEGTAGLAAMPNVAAADRRAKPGRRVQPSRKLRQQVAEMLDKKQLEETMVEIELTGDLDGYDPVMEFPAGATPDEMAQGFSDFIHGYAGAPHRRVRRRVPVKEARRLLTREEASKMIDFDAAIDEALARVEELGVVFIDEMDKIAGPKVEVGADVSGEGVQRDLLPVIEGSTVMTRYGPVKTDHVLFIGAGSFHHSKPSDLIPELQGRFPLRVELATLSQADFERILVEPENSLTKQYQALLATEGVELTFTEEGVHALAAAAQTINQRTENIGARRLHTVIERVLEDVSFNAPDLAGQRVVIDGAFVSERLAGLIKDEDLSRYIL